MPVLEAFIALAPTFAKLLDEFIKSPEEKRTDFIEKLNKAMEKTSTGDTIDLERLVGKI